MSRGFKRKHPEQVERAVYVAVLDRGMSAPASVELLAQGKLPGFAGRYQLPVGTAQQYVAAEKTRRREGLLKRADPATVQTEVAGQVALLLAELDRRSRAVNGSTSLEAIRELARAQRELVVTARACAAPGQRTPQATAHDHSDSSDSAPAPDLLDQLAAAPQPG